MFLLSKWYCDCVSDRGDAFIGYWARLTWGPVVIPYSAVLFKPAAGAVLERSYLRRLPGPQLADGQLRWESGRAGIAATWSSREAPCQHALLNNRDGAIVWRCHMARACATVRVAGDVEVRGLGYVEELQLSMHPRRLPFDEVRWGRFLSDADALTWIEWRGAEPGQWVFLNGRRLERARIGDERIDLPGSDGVLTLQRGEQLRDGALASTALRILPGSRHWLLRGIADAHESKWLSAGTLSTAARSSNGWAIHERVRIR